MENRGEGGKKKLLHFCSADRAHRPREDFLCFSRYPCDRNERTRLREEEEEGIPQSLITASSSSPTNPPSLPACAALRSSVPLPAAAAAATARTAAAAARTAAAAAARRSQWEERGCIPLHAAARRTYTHGGREEKTHRERSCIYTVIQHGRRTSCTHWSDLFFYTALNPLPPTFAVTPNVVVVGMRVPLPPFLSSLPSPFRPRSNTAAAQHNNNTCAKKKRRREKREKRFGWFSEG